MFGKILPGKIEIVLILGLFLAVGEVRSQDITSVMKEEGQISNFVNALENAQLAEELNGNGPYTIFAPSNRYFNSNNINSHNSNRSYLLNYIMTGMATERNLKAMSNITTLGGMVLELQKTDSGEIIIKERTITTANIKASNGIIHIIDGTF